MADEVKSERLHRVEDLQEVVAGEINARLVNTSVEVLVEGLRRGRWYGRTRTDKLVFYESGEDMTGRLVDVMIDRSSPWALQGHLVYNTNVLTRRTQLQ